jgi:outer membrane protein assembly factor BamB
MRTSTSGRLCAAFLLAFLAGASCLADWPVIRCDPQNTGGTPEAVKPPYKALWTIKGATNEALLVSNGKLYFTRKRGAFLRDLIQVDIKSKAEKKLVPNVAQTGAIAPSLGRIFTVLRAEEKPSSVSRLGANLWQSSIAAADLKTGAVLWKYPIGEHPATPAVSPITTDGKNVYMVNIPYTPPGDPVTPASLICLDSRTGEKVGLYEWTDLWKGQIGVTAGPPVIGFQGQRVAIALSYDGPAGYAGQLWVFRPGAAVSDGPFERIGDPEPAEGDASPHKGGTGWPAMIGSVMLSVSPGNILRTWDAQQVEASQAWSAKGSTGKALSITSGANPLIITQDSGSRKLSALSLANGKPLWTKNMNVMALSACTGQVALVPCQEQHPVKPGTRGRTDILDGVLYAVDARTGKALWSTRKSDVTYNQPAVGAGRVFVSDTDGNITCFAPAG